MAEEVKTGSASGSTASASPIIVVAIVVLLVLAVGFYLLKDKILPRPAASDNVPSGRGGASDFGGNAYVSGGALALRNSKSWTPYRPHTGPEYGKIWDEVYHRAYRDEVPRVSNWKKGSVEDKQHEQIMHDFVEPVIGFLKGMNLAVTVPNFLAFKQYIDEFRTDPKKNRGHWEVEVGEFLK